MAITSEDLHDIDTITATSYGPDNSNSVDIVFRFADGSKKTVAAYFGDGATAANRAEGIFRALGGTDAGVWHIQSAQQ